MKSPGFELQASNTRSGGLNRKTLDVMYLWQQDSKRKTASPQPHGHHHSQSAARSPFLQTASLALLLRRPPREQISGSNPACDEIFPGSSPTSDLKIGTPVPTLSGAWHYRVSAGTGWPCVSIL